MTKVLYLRVQEGTHGALLDYARAHGLSLSTAGERILFDGLQAAAGQPTTADLARRLTAVEERLYGAPVPDPMPHFCPKSCEDTGHVGVPSRNPPPPDDDDQDDRCHCGDPDCGAC
ncbi:MAG: hypothetical protein A2Y78_10220 [Acidobacteria bacterium RBG_13_68_16]|nr:MAG: hypothetical protein A2Y78_10220 [Acidobacteria bacterium RBG_13_68_16]